MDTLIDELHALRELMLEVEARLPPRLDMPDAAATASARNLAHWLALRAFDPRRIEAQLTTVGLAPLQRTGPQPLLNLDKALAMLYLLAGRGSTHPGAAAGEPAPAGTGRSRAEALFGTAANGPRMPIMVTLPRAAAVDDALVRQWVVGGMDLVRIDCAHDTANEWVALAGQVRRVAAANGRAVKVLMELAGPRLRTGPLAAGPAVLKLKPARDAFGGVVSPVRLGLRAPGAQATVPGATAHAGVDAAWLAALEIAEHIDLVDARGTARRLTVLGRCDQGVLVEGTRTVYLTPETRFKVHRRGQDAAATALCDLPATPGRLLLRRGDTLRLVRHGQGHDASDGSARSRVAVATVACTVPEALDAVRKGERVWFDRARIGGVVRRATAKGVEVEITDAAEEGSWLGGDKRIDLPDTRLDLPALTPRDVEDLAVVARHADLVGLSFAQGAADVKRLRRHLQRLGANEPGIVLRVETRRGFEQLPQLLFAALACRAAGVLVARDDLAVECGFARVAERQDEIVSACEAAQIPLLWAMQGPDSAVRAGLSWRAELADTARDVGAACVLLDKGPWLLDALRVLDRPLDGPFDGTPGNAVTGSPGSMFGGAPARPQPAKPGPLMPAPTGWDGVGRGLDPARAAHVPTPAMAAPARGRAGQADGLRTR